MASDKWADPQKMWDERFGQAELVYGEQPNAYLRAQSARLTPGCKILVPGDGYGRNGIWLAREGFQVSTVDLSPVGVARARKSAQEAGLTMSIEQADLASWTWPVDEFDAVASIFLHLPREVRPQIHAQMFGAVKPGGMLIIEAFRWRNCGIVRGTEAGGTPLHRGNSAKGFCRRDDSGITRSGSGD